MRHMKLFFWLLWLAFVGLAVWFWRQSGLEVKEVPARLHAWLGEFGLWRAGTIYILLYAARPLLLFPAAVLTIASGVIFGPWLGILFTLIGENASANIAFVLARWLGRDWVGASENGLILSWDRRIRERALVSVLVMRLVYLPFDAVNYGCGLTSMRMRDYALGTFLGIFPGVVSFVLLGGAAAPGVTQRAWILGGSLAFFVIGLGLARVFGSRAPERSTKR